jgi:tripartite-type tricarboxylate transporter receptor subunit TctC
VTKFRILLAALVPTALSAVAASNAVAQAQAPFYAGKQITLIIGSSAGGGYDVIARLMGRHLGRLLPGNPAIVAQNMPGAASLAATNYLFNQAAKDGTVIAAVQRNTLLAKFVSPQAVQFEIDKLNWIGSLNTETGLVVAMASTPHKSANDLLDHELIVGAQAGSDPEVSPTLYKALLGMKFKIVSGYPGSNEVILAMERGEVQGSGDWGISSLKAMRPAWLADGRIKILMQGAMTRHKELPAIPLPMEFAKNEIDRKVLELYFTQKSMARPVIAPPGLPAERLTQLRSAFEALATDAAFLADAERSRQDIEIVPGSKVDAIVATIASTPPEVSARLNEATAKR